MLFLGLKLHYSLQVRFKLNVKERLWQGKIHGVFRRVCDEGEVKVKVKQSKIRRRRAGRAEL